jgi:hypothetical protein
MRYQLYLSVSLDFSQNHSPYFPPKNPEILERNRQSIFCEGEICLKWIINVKKTHPIVKIFYMGLLWWTFKKERNIKRFVLNRWTFGGRCGVDRILTFHIFSYYTYFSYIVAVTCIVGGNWSAWRKPLTCHITNKLNHIMRLYINVYLSRQRCVRHEIW